MKDYKKITIELNPQFELMPYFEKDGYFKVYGDEEHNIFNDFESKKFFLNDLIKKGIEMTECEDLSNAKTKWIDESIKLLTELKEKIREY